MKYLKKIVGLFIRICFTLLLIPISLLATVEDWADSKYVRRSFIYYFEEGFTDIWW
jgi:hypothetical protein